MKKLFAILLALSLLVSLCAPAMAEDILAEAAGVEEAATPEPTPVPTPEPTPTPEPLPVVTGVWYGAMLGLGVELDLYEGGSYALIIDGTEGARNGLWTQDMQAVYLDAEQEHSLTLAYRDDTLVASLEGTQVVMTREPAAIFRPAEEKTVATARLRDFNGCWTCAMVGVFGMYVDPVSEAGDSPLLLNIEGKEVSLITADEEEPVSTTGIYDAGVLTIDLGADAELSCALRPLTDGSLRMDVATASGTVSYYLVPASAEEVIRFQVAEEAAEEEDEEDEEAEADIDEEEEIDADDYGEDYDDEVDITE